jgi:hypothetical protein
MTAITDVSTPSAARGSGQYFYFYMAAACAGVAFLGFAPTYWLPMASGTFRANPVVHIHGLLFSSWALFFCWQTWLAASGRIASHRSVGMIGISIATAMTIFGIMAAINAMKVAASAGLESQGVAFAIVPLSSILFFAVVFTLAIRAVRRPESHKRLMLLAAISILDAAVARWFMTFLAPPGPPGPPPVAVDLPPAAIAYSLLLIAIIYDWRTRGRPHPVYVFGGAALAALKVLNAPISATEAWHSFAGAILTLAR